MLLAEDDPTTTAVLTHRLGRDGFAVVACADGETAAALLAAEAFGVVLAGAKLPSVDGLGLLQRLRAGEGAARFVLLAWPGNDALLATAFALGADDVLVRPFSLTEAAARIGRLARRRYA